MVSALSVLYAHSPIDPFLFHSLPVSTLLLILPVMAMVIELSLLLPQQPLAHLQVMRSSFKVNVMLVNHGSHFLMPQNQCVFRLEIVTHSWVK